MRTLFSYLLAVGLCGSPSALWSQGPAGAGPSSFGHFAYLRSSSLRRIAIQPGAGASGQDALVVVEDGGRIRTSANGGTSWSFASTPSDAAQTLLDVRFPEGGNAGYAVGRAGRRLVTRDGGTSWQHLAPLAPIAHDAFARPAILWGVDFAPQNSQLGFAAGIASFARTDDGGATWSEVELFRDRRVKQRLEARDFELYAIDLRPDPEGGWIGTCIGEWAHRTPEFRSLGVVFVTRSRDRRTRDGQRWWMSFCTSAMQEPWDLDFATPTSGFLVGGTGTASGCILRTEDGGFTWTGPEPLHANAATRFFATLYGVADLGAGNAIAVGYAGHIWVRDPASGTWLDRFAPGYTGPLLDVQGIPGTARAWACGAFGFLRHTDDGGETWTSQNGGELVVRVRDAALRDERVGLLVGQPPQVLRTEDGGASFTRAFPAAGDRARGVQLEAVTWIDAQRAIAVGTDGLVLRSMDEGRTWSEAGVSGVPRSMRLADVAQRFPGQIWAVGDEPTKDGVAARVLLSTDDGSTWIRLPDPPGGERAALHALAFPQPTEVLVVGGSQGRAYAASFDDVIFNGWRDVSPPLGSSRAPRELRALAIGNVGNELQLLAGGDRGTLLRWNFALRRFEGVAQTFEFDPATGAVLLQRAAQDISALGIDHEGGSLFVGFTSAPSFELSPSHGFAWRFDGSTWSELPCGTNQNARAFTFGGSGAQRTGWMAATMGPGGTSEGTIADSALLRLER
ncbi:MAG: hypothetical protein JNM84_12165 [Planctomycetes bacterium]|nr:hypothetical protein [Planctomycetota bacterium]